jgi:hypothetical protein
MSMLRQKKQGRVVDEWRKWCLAGQGSHKYYKMNMMDMMREIYD